MAKLNDVTKLHVDRAEWALQVIRAANRKAGGEIMLELAEVIDRALGDLQCDLSDAQKEHEANYDLNLSGLRYRVARLVKADMALTELANDATPAERAFATGEWDAAAAACYDARSVAASGDAPGHDACAISDDEPVEHDRCDPAKGECGDCAYHPRCTSPYKEVALDDGGEDEAPGMGGHWCEPKGTGGVCVSCPSHDTCKSPYRRA